MNAIKRQFKDFWAYFRLCRLGCDQKYMKDQMLLLIAVMCGTLFPFMQASLAGAYSGSGFSFNLWWFVLVGAAFGVGLSTSQRPTLLSVAPFTPKQRVVFSYLTMILQTFIFAVVYLVLMIAAMALVALVYFIFWGENIFVVSNDPEYTDIVRYSANGEAVQIMFMVINAFSVYAAMNLKRFRSRCWATVGFYIGYEIFTLALVNGCSRALGGTNFRLVGDVWHWVDGLTNGWIITVIMALLVTIAFALSLALSIRRHKSYKF